MLDPNHSFIAHGRINGREIRTYQLQRQYETTLEYHRLSPKSRNSKDSKTNSNTKRKNTKNRLFKQQSEVEIRPASLDDGSKGVLDMEETIGRRHSSEFGF
jgi:hypothetical protein